MIRLSKSVLAVGGVVLAGGLITLMNPRTVHAVVAAALVQVTNTAANPAVTQSVGAQAGNMVHLSCPVTLERTNFACFHFLANGSDPVESYTVPAGESLVITSLDVTPKDLTGCPGNYDLFVGTPSQVGAFLFVTTTNALVTTHFAYPYGLVIGEGITPTFWGASATFAGLGSCAGLVTVDIFGYLTTA